MFFPQVYTDKIFMILLRDQGSKGHYQDTFINLSNPSKLKIFVFVLIRRLNKLGNILYLASSQEDKTIGKKTEWDEKLLCSFSLLLSSFTAICFYLLRISKILNHIFTFMFNFVLFLKYTRPKYTFNSFIIAN